MFISSTEVINIYKMKFISLTLFLTFQCSYQFQLEDSGFLNSMMQQMEDFGVSVPIMENLTRSSLRFDQGMC